MKARTVQVIALNTFKEAIRDRILYLLLFFAAVAILFSRVLALLTVGDRTKIIKDVGLASISLFGALMAILIGTGLVYKEIEKRTIFTLISKPIRRHEFLLGKYFGLVLTLFVMLLCMSVIFLVLIFFQTWTVEWKLLVAIFSIFIELILITAVAVLFSCFSTPILSSLFALCFYLIGHFSWSLETLIKKARPGAGRTLLRVLDAVLPDLENFNLKTEVVHGLPISAAHVLYATAYGVVYAAFVLTLAVLIFRRRDFI
ncbi:MAG: ABC transporter permease [Candidatus Aminicenantales bacterium]|jgi:ABC-type transport system involved in multi-copper enzyme maturation permease subunit